MRVQEPITTDVPLGLDEPAPILVWRCGLTVIDESLSPGAPFAVGIDEQAALAIRAFILCTYPSYFLRGEPYRLPLDDAMRCARSVGSKSLQIRDESLQIIEEYPL